MAFIRKIKPKRTCKDFKPSFWDRNGCRLTHLCGDAKNHWIEFGKCIGIKPQELVTPKGLRSGVPNKHGCGVKPETKRPKPKSRPRKKIKIGLTEPNQKRIF